MVSGRPLSNSEKKYIEEHKNTQFVREIASNLGKLFPQDNKGSRGRDAVRAYIRNLEEEEYDPDR